MARGCRYAWMYIARTSLPPVSCSKPILIFLFQSHKAHHDAPLNIDIFAAKLGVSEVRIRYDPSLGESAKMEALLNTSWGVLKLVSEAGPGMAVRDVFERVQNTENAKMPLYGIGKFFPSRPPPLVTELLAVCAIASPSRIALDFEGSESTNYGDLDNLSTALAINHTVSSQKP